MKKNLIKGFIVILLLGLIGFNPLVHAESQQEELYATALRAFDDGFYDVSIKYLEQLQNDFPSNPKLPQVKFLLGQSYFLKNRFIDAQNMFNSLNNTFDNKELLLFWSAEVSLKLNNYPEAQEKYKELIDGYPESAYLPQAYYSYGWSFFDQKKYKEAKDLLGVLVDKFPKHQLAEDAYLKIAQCFYDMGDYRGALTKFIKYLNHYPQSEHQLEVYLNIADTYYYMEDFENAKNYYDKVLKATDVNVVFTAYSGKIWSYLKLKRYAESEKVLKEAQDFAKSKNLPGDDLLLVKANIALEKGEMQAAIDVYEDLIKNYPKSERYFEAYLGKANVYFLLKKFDEALLGYSFIIQKTKDEDLLVKASLGVAWAYAKLNNLNQAKIYFQNVVDLTNKSDVKVNALTQMADALSDADKTAEALVIYDTIIKTYPDNVMMDYILHRQAIALLKVGKTQAALNAFENLKDNFSTSRYLDDIDYYVGLAAFKKNNYKTAVAKMENYLKSNSRASGFMSEANYVLAVSYLNLKQPEEALKLFQKILRLYPDDQNVARNSDIGIAKCQFQLGQIKEAVKRFKLIVFKYPKTEAEYESLLWLAQFYLKNADYLQAIDYYQQIIDRFAQHAGMDQINYEMGQAYEIQGMFDQALEKYKQISNGDLVLFSKAKLAIAGIFAKEFDVQKAAQAYEAIATDSPELARESYFKVAQLYRNNQSYDRELEYYQKALNVDAPKAKITNAELFFYMADTYELMGRFDDAISGYLKIYAQYADQKEWVVKAYLRVARIFEDRKDWSGAKLTYQKIVQLNVEESKFAQERLDWINANTGGKK